MKVYVDDNEDYRITYSSRDGSECLESMGMQPIVVESLADHTKQVRKEVLDDLAISLATCFSSDAEFTKDEIVNWLQKVKDQIGETK